MTETITITAHPTNAHPLDPLTEAEVRVAAATVREHEELALRFVSIGLREPSDGELTAHPHGGPPRREAFVVAYHPHERAIVETTVDLERSAVVDRREQRGALPPVARPDFELVNAVVPAAPGWQAAMRARGVNDLEAVEIHPWPPGFHDAAHAGRRIARALTYLRAGLDDNVFARPVEGLVVTIDLDSAEVLAVEDTGAVDVPAPVVPAPPDRADVRPLAVTQAAGPSFELDGRELRWQKWSLRVGFTHREGIVLHQVRYRDAGRDRSILRRAALSEMWVPYGDPGATHAIKNVFDEGEVGLGAVSNPLRLGCDCLGEIRYLDAVVGDPAGEPVVIANAICVHEEDTGVAWKHTDDESGRVEVRRGRRLVVSSFATIGNYDYGFFWYLHTDGSIAYEVKLTGVVATGAVAPGERPAHGTLVAPGLHGPNHHHFFNVRLDVAVDGARNSVDELDSVADPLGPANPLGNAWRVRRARLVDERGAQRLADAATQRTWVVVNERARNALGDPVGYQLVPGPVAPPLLHPDAPALRRAAFATRQLWVTAYDPRELYAAGDYPFHGDEDTGLGRYVEANRPVDDADIVVWHTFAAHHVVRPEDWPVMPVATTGFHLRPFGFFDANPALDLPRPSPAERGHANANGSHGAEVCCH